MSETSKIPSEQLDEERIRNKRLKAAVVVGLLAVGAIGIGVAKADSENNNQRQPQSFDEQLGAIEQAGYNLVVEGQGPTQANKPEYFQTIKGSTATDIRVACESPGSVTVTFLQDGEKNMGEITSSCDNLAGYQWVNPPKNDSLDINGVEVIADPGQQWAILAGPSSNS